MMRIMSKVNKILTGLVIVLLIALGVVLYWQKTGQRETYSAVYLNTGDIYFGKLSRFPRMTLRDVWFLQKQGDGQGFKLVKFGDAIWDPRDELLLNERQVVWVTELQDDSEVVRTIQNPQRATASQAETMTAQQAVMQQPATQSQPETTMPQEIAH